MKETLPVDEGLLTCTIKLTEENDSMHVIGRSLLHVLSSIIPFIFLMFPFDAALSCQ